MNFTIIIITIVSLLTQIGAAIIHSGKTTIFAQQKILNDEQMLLLSQLIESIPKMIRVVSGFVSDVSHNPEQILVLSYATICVGKIILTYITSSYNILPFSLVPIIYIIVQFVDRIMDAGRDAPRELLVLQNTTPENRSFTFSFRKAVATIGSIIGPIITYIIIRYTSYTPITKNTLLYIIALIPMIIAVGLLIFLLPNNNSSMNIISSTNINYLLLILFSTLGFYFKNDWFSIILFMILLIYFMNNLLSKNKIQTLDTWFSSALWHFNKKIDVLPTAYDILFFWLARMQIMSKLTKQEFSIKEYFIHDLVRDKYGKKMSKTYNNVLEPQEIINKYGEDVFRLTLLSQISPGSKISIDKFQLDNIEKIIIKLKNVHKLIKSFNFIEENQNPLIQEINNYFQEKIDYLSKEKEYHVLLEKLENFFYNDFANILLEMGKNNQFLIPIIQNIYIQILQLWYIFIPKLANNLYEDIESEPIDLFHLTIEKYQSNYLFKLIKQLKGFSIIYTDNKELYELCKNILSIELGRGEIQINEFFVTKLEYDKILKKYIDKKEQYINKLNPKIPENNKILLDQKIEQIDNIIDLLQGK